MALRIVLGGKVYYFRTASIATLVLSDTTQWLFCFLTIQSAAFPVNPLWYASMDCQAQLMNLQIVSSGHESKHVWAAALALANVGFQISQYLYLQYPQY